MLHDSENIEASALCALARASAHGGAAGGRAGGRSEFVEFMCSKKTYTLKQISMI